MKDDKAQDPGSTALAKLAALADEGEYVADGAFTLDPAQAHAKLREHQLEDPAAYVLLLVEAAWLAGLGGIRSELRFTHGTTTTAEFEGLELDASTLAGLLAAVFASTSSLEGEALRQARATQKLGLAINAALALEPRELLVEQFTPAGECLRARFEAGVDPQLERTSHPTPGPRARTRVSFVGGPLDLLRGPREAQLLSERACYAGFPVLSEGQRVSRGLLAALGDEPGPRVEVALSEPRRVIGAATLAGDQRATLQVLTRGVLSERVPLVGYRAGFGAVIEADLRKDLSQRQVLRNASFRAVLDAVEDAHAALPDPEPEPELEPEPEPDPLVITRERGWQLALIGAIFFVALVIGATSIYSSPPRMISPAPEGLKRGQQWLGDLSCDESELPLVLEVNTLNLEQGRVHLERPDGSMLRQRVYLRGSFSNNEEIYVDHDEWVEPPSEAEVPLEFDCTLTEDLGLLVCFTRTQRSLLGADESELCVALLNRDRRLY